MTTLSATVMPINKKLLFINTGKEEAYVLFSSIQGLGIKDNIVSILLNGNDLFYVLENSESADAFYVAIYGCWTIYLENK